MRAILLIFLFLVFFKISTYSQGSKGFQIWTDVTLAYKLNKKWKIGEDVGYRIEPKSSNQTLYIRPGVNFKASKVFNFSLGAANFNNWFSSTPNLTEIRIFQFVTINWPNIAGFYFKHRLGLEQRAFFVTNSDKNEVVHRG